MLLLLILEKSMFKFLHFFRCIKKPLTCLYTFIIIFYLLIYSFMPIMKGKAEHVRKNSAVYNIITCSKTLVAKTVTSESLRSGQFCNITTNFSETTIISYSRWE